MATWKMVFSRACELLRLLEHDFDSFHSRWLQSGQPNMQRFPDWQTAVFAAIHIKNCPVLTNVSKRGNVILHTTETSTVRQLKAFIVYFHQFFGVQGSFLRLWGLHNYQKLGVELSKVLMSRAVWRVLI